jgi:hypothetical protein
MTPVFKPGFCPPTDQPCAVAEATAQGCRASGAGGRYPKGAVRALAVLDRGQTADGDDSQASVWGSIHASPNATPVRSAVPSDAIVPLIYDRRAAARKPRKTKRKS